MTPCKYLLFHGMQTLIARQALACIQFKLSVEPALIRTTHQINLQLLPFQILVWNDLRLELEVNFQQVFCAKVQVCCTLTGTQTMHCRIHFQCFK